MPSGAKKRKAAKKKKQLGGGGGGGAAPQINTSQGNEDAKNQDDKGSDNGEIDSPTSQNHLSESNPFGEGNKEIQESSSSNAAGASNVETYQKVSASDRKNVNVQNESVKGSRDGDRSTSTSTSSSSSSSSSSSDAEDTTKKPEVLDGKTDDLVAPSAASIVSSVTPEVLASEETIDAESASVENTSMPDRIVSKKLETAPYRVNEVTYVPVTATRDISSKPNENRNLHLSAHIAESSESFNPESEEQPLIEPKPPVPQRTSWLSCCGLCDIITGSNR